jgi:hypothetical protein
MKVFSGLLHPKWLRLIPFKCHKRSIHALFKAFLFEKPHEYCAKGINKNVNKANVLQCSIKYLVSKLSFLVQLQ